MSTETKPPMNFETALAHLGAYLEGGDELGEVSKEDASAALDHLRTRLQESERLVSECADVLAEVCEESENTLSGVSPIRKQLLEALQAYQAAGPEN